MEFWNRLKTVLFEGFWASVKSVGLLSLIGTVGGTALVLWGKTGPLPKNHEVIALVVEHLGIGFIVSSIAVFGYEWRALSKKTIDLSERLTRLLLVEGEAALDRALAELIPSGNRKLPVGAEEVSSNCKTVIMSISNLMQTTRRVDEQYVSFVSGLLKAVVKKNAEALVDLHRKEREVKFKVPATASVLADDILAAQMRAMMKGERYRVISDLSSWSGNQLADFHEASREAVGRGVITQRIFNLYHLDDNDSLSSREVRDILTKHLQAMSSWKDKRGKGSYEARVFGARGRERGRDLQKSGHQLRKMHFGIFSLGKGEMVRFRVTEPDLSEIMISRDQDEIKPDFDDFSALWEVSPKLSQDLIREVVQEFEEGAQIDSPKERDRREELVRRLGGFMLERLNGFELQVSEVDIFREILGEGIDFLDGMPSRQSFSSVTIREEGNSHSERLVLPATEATFGDLILSAYMQGLGEGESYDAISDLPSWQGRQLAHFRDATEEAVRHRGVAIRRIFHVLREEASGITEAEIVEILGQHLKDSYRWSGPRGNYRVRFFGKTELNVAISMGLDLGSMVQVEDFGIFLKSDGGIRFGVLARDMTRVRLTSKTSVVSREREIFETLWSHARDLTEEGIAIVAAELKGLDLGRKGT